MRRQAWLGLLVCCALAACSDSDSTTGPTGTSATNSSGGSDNTGCAGRLAECGDDCVDTSVDPNNCGSCGQTCADGKTCVEGACALECGGGTSECSGKCVDTSLDPNNCGGCDSSCSASEVCAGGGCCALGLLYCDATCTDVTASDCHCGACGNTCSGATPHCLNSTCVAVLADCNAYKQLDANAPDGAYAIDPDGEGGEPPFNVYCDMNSDGGGWTMVAKLSSGVAGDANAIWNGGALNDSDPTLLDANKAASHYISKLVGLWNNGFTVTSARVHINVGGVMSKFFRFSATGSDATNWFSLANVSSTSYTDMFSQPHNYFAIAGDGGNGRRFFVQRSYSGCGNDLGWLVVDSAPDACTWETGSGSELRILHSVSSSYVNWANVPANGKADALLVLVK